jgi:hypothetical protein
MISFLLPVTPRGLHTADVESLDCYVRRLAEAHGTTPFILLRVLTAWWNETNKSDRTPVGRLPTNIIPSGSGQDVEDLLAMLECGTGFSGLGPMTLRAFSEISGQHVGKIFRRAHSWCPACMQEWEREDSPPYEKLLWRLKPITRCALHKLQLMNSCYKCGIIQNRGQIQSWFRCCNCATRLCADSKHWTYSPKATHGERDLIEVIQYCSLHPNFKFRNGTPEAFLKLKSANCGTRLFARALGDYFHSGHSTNKHLICSLLRVAQHFQVSFTDLLIDPKRASKVHPLPDILSLVFEDHPSRRTIPACERELLRRELSAALKQGIEGKSANRACEELGFSPNRARQWFPVLAAQLIDHQTCSRQAVRERQEERLLGITKATLACPEYSSVGWHKLPETVAERLELPIFMARRRLERLRR